MIKVDQLSFAYKPPDNVLHQLNFTVNRGEIFGFLGPNGSGKSTTQKVLLGILPDYQGSVIINDYHIKEVAGGFYEDIGVLFEMPYLYSTLSAVDNLKYFSNFYPRHRVRQIDELLDLVGLERGFRHKQVKHYSKGMRQRTSLARCLLNSPQTLFLDEPVSGLDPAGAVLVKQIIKQEQSRGTTIFLTTHNMFVADELCDRVAFIVEGRINTIDTPDKLKHSHSDSIVEIEYIDRGQKKQISLDAQDFNKNIGFSNDRIVSIKTRGQTLEDIFIKLTGKRLSND